MNTDNTLLNATIGAVATFALSFTAISPVIGGALAAYLEDGTRNDGLRVGALAGLIALVPVLLMVSVGVVFFIGAGAAGGAGLIVIGLLFGAVYVVGLSALGGYIGTYLKHNL